MEFAFWHLQMKEETIAISGTTKRAKSSDLECGAPLTTFQRTHTVKKEVVKFN
jgi:hypothetical protein